LIDSFLQVLKKDGAEQYSLEAVLEASTKAVLQGGMNVLLVSTLYAQTSLIDLYVIMYAHACMYAIV
jgi:hypothetical protein